MFEEEVVLLRFQVFIFAQYLAHPRDCVCPELDRKPRTDYTIIVNHEPLIDYMIHFEALVTSQLLWSRPPQTDEDLQIRAGVLIGDFLAQALGN